MPPKTPRRPSPPPASEPAPEPAPLRLLLQKLLENRSLLRGVAGGIVLLLAVIGWAVFSGGSADHDDEDELEETFAEDSDSGSGDGKSRVTQSSSSFHGLPLLPQQFKTVTCRVYTPEPGFFVLVDGEPARKKTGDKLITPCELSLTEGEHSLTVVKKGFKDSTNQVLAIDGREFEFTPTFEPFAVASGYFASQFALAEVGEEIPLIFLNTEGKVLDPFVTPDGLSIWFGGDRQGKRGVYVARRESVLDRFGDPELLVATQVSQLPSSPSVTGDELQVVYTIADEARIWSVTRVSKEVGFSERKLLLFSDREEDRWRSAQILASGKTLYCARERQGTMRPIVTSRSSLEQKFSKKWKIARMPGSHPCLSSDGLRQFVFDGTVLSRSSRRKIGDQFSPPEPIAELSLEHYTHRPEYRQIFVSDDEQWMYFTDDPVRLGNLYAVRISKGPGWGFVARGKSIPQKEPEVADTDSPDNATDGEMPADVPKKPAAKAEPPVDPRTRPLPYAELRAKVDALLAVSNVEEAIKLVTAAQADPKFKEDAEPLKWDAEDIRLVQGFWKEVTDVLGKMKDGDPIRIGPLQMAFKSFADGKINTDVNGQAFSKELREMNPSDVVALADRAIDKSSEHGQLQIAAFLSCDPKVRSQTVTPRLQRAGEAGKTFLERQSLRKLHVIEREFERDNISAGIKLIEAILADDPKSDLANRAQALREKLYTQIEWRPVGGQTWDLSKPGVYVTTGRRANDSFLVSPRDYANFELSLEWMTTATPAPGGVWFRYQSGGSLRGNAYKVQVANDYAIRGNPDRFSTGSLFGVRGPTANMVKPGGEWNTLRIRAIDERLRVWVNGAEVLDTPLTDTNIGKKGYVCLDGVFPGIAYRKIMLFELPPGAK